jgi:hypothetical protein
VTKPGRPEADEQKANSQTKHAVSNDWCRVAAAARSAASSKTACTVTQPPNHKTLAKVQGAWAGGGIQECPSQNATPNLWLHSVQEKNVAFVEEKERRRCKR